MYTLGIDPGLKGAIALLCNSKIVDVWDMPVVSKTRGKGNEVSATLVANIIDEVLQYSDDGELVAIVEAVHAMPGNGATSMFGFGRSVGVIAGVLAANKIKTIMVRPQEWKKKFSLNKKEKDASRGLVLEMFPDKADLFNRKKDCDRADAVLMSLWGVTEPS